MDCKVSCGVLERSIFFSSTLTSSEKNLKSLFPFKYFNAYGRPSIIYLLIFHTTLTTFRLYSADIWDEWCFAAKLFVWIRTIKSKLIFQKISIHFEVEKADAKGNQNKTPSNKAAVWARHRTWYRERAVQFNWTIDR